MDHLDTPPVPHDPPPETAAPGHEAPEPKEPEPKEAEPKAAGPKEVQLNEAGLEGAPKESEAQAPPHPQPDEPREQPAVAPGAEKLTSPRPIRNAHPVRVLLMVAAVFIGLFLLTRTLAIEPFGVPTGSMAPALIGHHRDGPCPRCGYHVLVGRPSVGSAGEHFSHVSCPNCDFRFSLASAPDVSGDRLLVDKNIYSLRNPRRWEMVVFRCPDTDPKESGKPYVKRLIGLPLETITIRDGDVYVDDQIVRKGLAEVRETMTPIFDMSFPPRPAGWGVRWLVAAQPDPRLPAGVVGARAATPVIENNALILEASDSPQTMAGVTYRNWHLDDQKEEAIRAWTAYDGEPRHFGQLPAAHDFILTCDVEVTAAAAGNEASFACRLMDGADAVSAEISVGEKQNGRAQLVSENFGRLATAAGVALVPGRSYRLEFAFVDRRVLLALDGDLVVPPADLPPAKGRGEVRRPLQLGARGCRVALHNLVLHRDIHYTQYGEHGTRHPITLGPGEYYVLGDNSGNSQDSRKWPKPGVPVDDFIGKPFLIHQPLRLSRVSVGGRERAFQTLDWARLRWLH